MSEKYVLALDLGTTGNRVLVFDSKQNIIFSAYEEFPQIFPKPGWVEHDAVEIWKVVLRLLGKTFSKVAIEKIAAIGITNQRETVVAWDKTTGKPFHNAIVWQDRRTADYCEKLKSKGLAEKVHKKTGLFLDPYFSGTKVHWYSENLKNYRDKVRQKKALIGTIDTWILWNLSKGQCHATDTSNASRTLLFNIQNLSWDKELCTLFHADPSILPQVTPSSGKIGFLDKSFFGRQIPVTGIAGDQQAAAFAQGCFKPGTIKNTYGTGLFLVENTGKKPRYSQNLLTTVAWSLGDLKNTDYAVEGSVFIGGAAIQWLRDGLKIIQKAADTEKMAKSLSSNEGVYFVPALVGLGAPHWDPNARGMVIGITRGTKREHFVRAALESIVYQTRDLMEIMKKDTHTSFKTLRVDGGATSNDFLMQLQADTLGIQVERPKILETTALGAAALAGIDAGIWKSQDDFVRARKINRLFKPKAKSRALMEANYASWKRAVERSLQWIKS